MPSSTKAVKEKIIENKIMSMDKKNFLLLITFEITFNL